MAVCPECGAELETLLGCAACGAPLATADDVTPFAAFGLEPAAAIDARELKQRLLRFSRIVHPDFHGSDPARRALAERSTAALNDAYAVLSDDAARYDWLVRHLGGPDQDTERQMPQAFLMEVMEWNEALEEAREAPPDAPLPGALEALAGTWRSERARALDEVAGALTPLPERAAEALTRARRKLNAVRYLDRALTELRALRLARAAS
jgi:molecular chaperone HscB